MEFVSTINLVLQVKGPWKCGNHCYFWPLLITSAPWNKTFAFCNNILETRHNEPDMKLLPVLTFKYRFPCVNYHAHALSNVPQPLFRLFHLLNAKSRPACNFCLNFDTPNFKIWIICGLTKFYVWVVLHVLQTVLNFFPVSSFYIFSHLFNFLFHYIFY